MQIFLIISLSLLLVLAMVVPFASPFFRFCKYLKPTTSDTATTDDEELLTEWNDITILITTHKNARQLENNIEQYLNQDYPANYQVVVVVEKGDSDTEDVLKRHAANEHLYYTFIPESARYMSRKKLAVTLGIKAARYEWIVMTEPECTPPSSTWLKTFASQCTESHDLVMGYCKLSDDSPAYYRFNRLQTSLYLMREALHSTAFRTDCQLLAFRKSVFINGDGYRGYLQFIGGEYDFIVNKYAGQGNTAVVINPEGWVLENEPKKKKWLNTHLYYINARASMSRRNAACLLFNLDNTLLHTQTVATLTLTTTALLMEEWVAAAIAPVLWLGSTYARYALAKSSLSHFEEPFGIIKFWLYDITTVYHNAANIMHYWRADKYDFTTHK